MWKRCDLDEMALYKSLKLLLWLFTLPFSLYLYIFKVSFVYAHALIRDVFCVIIRWIHHFLPVFLPNNPNNNIF